MSLKTRINNIAKEKNIRPQIVLQNYMFERFLYRLSKTKYAKNLIIKGGLLISSLVDIAHRNTMDLDATLKNLQLNNSKIEELFKEVNNVETDDNLEFEMFKVEEIRPDDEYGGLKASVLVKYFSMQLTLKFDFTTGDAITPNEILTTYNTLFGDEINILAYNIETILAEKLQTIFYRGIGNTRPRDYYDVYILGSLKNDMIDVNVLKNAIRNTAEHRQTPNIFSEWQSTLEEFGNSNNLQSQWNRYVGENNYASGIAFNDALGKVEHLMKMVNNI